MFYYAIACGLLKNQNRILLKRVEKANALLNPHTPVNPIILDKLLEFFYQAHILRFRQLKNQ